MLLRKFRRTGNSFVITIPTQLAEAHEINEGDTIQIIPVGIGEFLIKKYKKETKSE